MRRRCRFGFHDWGNYGEPFRVTYITNEGRSRHYTIKQEQRCVLCGRARDRATNLSYPIKAGDPQ